METNQLNAPEKQAKATALSQRKASEAYLIPWEEDIPFKMTQDYVLQFYAGKKNVKDSKWRADFNDFYSFEEFSLSLKEKGEETYTLYLQLTPQHLSVRCSCGHIAEQLCEHAAASLYDKFSNHYPFYLKRLYNEKLLAVPKKYRAMLNVVLIRSYSGPYLELANNSNYGHIYQLDITPRNDAHTWGYTPIAQRGAGPALAETTSVEFMVIANKLHYGVPYLLPYVPKNKAGRSISKSYLFYEGEDLSNLSAEDLFKERISKRMLEIADDEEYCFSKAIDFDERSYRNAGSKAQGILQEWRKLIHTLSPDETLCFVHLYGYRSEPNRAKLKDVLRKEHYRVCLANGEVRVKIQVEEHPSFLRLQFQLYYKDQRIDQPQFVSEKDCFFLLTAENHAVFIDDLDLEKVLREARQADYIVTALDTSRQHFLEHVVRPLAQRYTLEVKLKGKNGSTAVHIKKPERMVQVSVSEEFMQVSMAVEYKGYGRYPLAPHANIVVGEALEERDFHYGHRLIEHERTFLHFIQGQHDSWSEQTHESLFTIPLKEINRTEWFTRFIQHCEEEGIRVVLENIQRGTSYYPHTLHWEVRQVQFEQNKCSILMALKFGDKAIPLAEFEEKISNSANVYYLGENQYGVIRPADIVVFRPLLLAATIDEDRLIVNTTQMISLQRNLEQISPKIINDSIRERRERLANLDEIPPLPIPSTVQATLRSYQQAGFSWLAFLNEFQWGGLLADDMGLGKTLQVITLLEHFYQSTPQGPASLVVLPNSLLFNWQSEYQKFAPDRRVVLYHGPERHGMSSFDAASIVLTTYGTIMLADEAFIANNEFAYLIMDESQNVKNRNSKRFECLSSIKALYRIAMTGTPVENGIQDIYAQMSLVNPGFFSNYRAFNKLYKVKNEENSAATLSSLQQMIQPFILRRTKKQVALDLPDKTETILYVDMPPSQRKIYDRYRKMFKEEITESLEREDSSKSAFIAIEGLVKLRQLCNSPSLLKGENFAPDAVKLDYIDEILSDVAPGHKVLLFSSFTGMLKLVGERIHARGVQYAYLDGKLSQMQRQAAVLRFQEEEECRIFLISLKAGGTGLNLTAADYVYILDPWWNPAAEAQAIDRCYRIGQVKHVNAYKLVCRDSVEEKIIALQAQKKKLADGLILNDTNIMKSLGKEELLKLFE